MRLDHLYRDVTLPPMARVRRWFTVDHVADIPGTVQASMDESGIAARLSPGQTIAIGVGSRGINALPDMVAEVVAWFARHGTNPFIFPAMGSHGGATSEGQARMLVSLGVTEDRVGCPIRSEIEATKIGEYRTSVGKDLDFYFDSHAVRADGVFVLARIKAHPGFVARHESGLAKMLTIGCGKHIAAETYHRLGFAHFPEIMAGIANAILERMPQILGGLAIVENAAHGTSHVECAPHERMMERDAALLRQAKARQASLPLKMLHALVIDYMGKNIAGPGQDPSITGRYLTGRSSDVDVRGMAVLNLTPETDGNANGMGAADFITQRMRDAIDFDTTYLNALTDPATIGYAVVPPVMPHDRGAMSMALKKGNTFDDPALMVRIRDTLTLDRFFASPAVLAMIAEDPAYSVLDEPQPMAFDPDGNLIDLDETWDRF